MRPTYLHKNSNSLWCRRHAFAVGVVVVVFSLFVLPLNIAKAVSTTMMTSTATTKFHLATDMRAKIDKAVPTTTKTTAGVQQLNGTNLSSSPSSSGSSSSSSSAAAAAAAVVTECGNTDAMMENCFKELPLHLVEFLQTTNFPADKETITTKCTVFHRVMSCFEEYATRCLSNESRSHIDINVDNAKRFFHKFCNNAEFQRAYLKHKDCLNYIKDDWDRCTDNFKEIMLDELHVDNKSNLTKKFVQMCCARMAYEECIYKSARYKCYPDSAEYALDLAKLLSEEQYFSNCRQYEQTFCPSDLLRGTRSTASGMVKPLQLHVIMLVVLTLALCSICLWNNIDGSERFQSSKHSNSKESTTTTACDCERRSDWLKAQDCYFSAMLSESVACGNATIASLQLNSFV